MPVVCHDGFDLSVRADVIQVTDIARVIEQLNSDLSESGAGHSNEVFSACIVNVRVAG